MLEGASDDAYRPGAKARGPAHCRKCGAVFRNGRWTWTAAPAGAARLRCPACRRIDEGSPAGYIALSGGFFSAHRSEVLACVRNCEKKEKTTHPLERIMAIRPAGDGTMVTTTSVHLARRVAHALESAFKGTLNIAYNHQDNLLRVRWSRAAGRMQEN
jgi:NMD protein affecting ribosome stability and mRNA decay